MGRAVSRKPVLISWSVPGDVSVGIKCDARVLSDDEEDVDFDIIHNANDTFTVKYVPPAAGRYTIKVLFASQVCVWTWVLSGHLCSYFLFAFFSNREGVLRTLPNSFPLCFLKTKKEQTPRTKIVSLSNKSGAV